MKTISLYISIFAIGFAFFFVGRWIWALTLSRRQGSKVWKKNPTLFDVRELIIKGEKDLAIRLYCYIYFVSFKKGKKAVEDLQRSIQMKNSP